ncbi:MAG: transcription-repair coupling factor [Acidimicrobiia bacterium]|nr:transcription-repair coupling factor [Acidimicrobiia bacterium]
MNAPLEPLISAWPESFVPQQGGRLVVPPALRAVTLAGIAPYLDRPLLAVVPGERTAEELYDDTRLFADSVWQLPAWGTLPFEHVSPNQATMAHRCEALYRLAEGRSGTIVIASVRAATQRLSASDFAPIVVEAAVEHGFDRLVAELTVHGYHRTDRVEARGEYAVRGGIVDVFPAQDIDPYRIEFWGDEIDEIRSFRIGSQRSVEKVDRIEAFPARELRPDPVIRERAGRLLHEQPWATETWDRIAAGLTFQGLESWLPWLAEERTVFDIPGTYRTVVFDPVQARARSEELQREEADLAATLAPTWGSGAPGPEEHPTLFLPLPDSLDVEAPPIAAGPSDKVVDIRGLDAVPGDADSITTALRHWQGRDVEIVVAMDGTGAAERIARLLSQAGHALPVRERLARVESAVLGEGIHRGFVAPQLGFGVVGEQEVAGRRRAHRRSRQLRDEELGDAYRDLSPGDFVVHHHHGIGRFEGLVHREMAGVERDYLLIRYHGEDRLYVPTDQLAAVVRYTGGESPRLSRMGGADWAKTRTKVRKAVAAVAEAVVELHRSRAAAPGHAFERDTPWQAEFESAFPYEETRDQVTAIGDVKADMEAPAPMDRLIFGDVGFGKTEIALRAAFKAIQSGKQVALLVPTTLLAQQHFSNIEERFAAYPIEVASLSRFLTAGQQRDVIRGLGEGTVDLVVGTHRLLSEDVEFRDLGLLIVDEEQRFGVAAKDKLKRLRTSIDVLTLTATPIPRTLEMALTGIREVSHIRTPPEDRHPILTYVGPFDERAISAAIRRELLREGQVFYVHNRVQSIDHAVARLRELVPDARYAVAHGQMSEGTLEQVMFDFWNGDYDVLVATTIIESGLDLPQVNTLLVERSDRLGLAQLYQLRGRVGRSNQRAYAYLFHPREQTLSESAYRRLEAIGEYSDLGSGFELAMRDLEIRGAGSILGETQAGHISAVGFELYVELVSDAVTELRGEAAQEHPPEVRIDVPVDAHLPNTYVESANERLEAYRRLAAADTEQQVADVGVEWRDRFGEPPPQATALLDVALLRVEALRVGLTEIVKVRDEVRLGPVALKPSQEVRLDRLAPRAIVRGPTVFLPAPRRDLVQALIGFVRKMWPPEQENPR